MPNGTPSFFCAQHELRCPLQPAQRLLVEILVVHELTTVEEAVPQIANRTLHLLCELTFPLPGGRCGHHVVPRRRSAHGTPSSPAAEVRTRDRPRPAAARAPGAEPGQLTTGSSTGASWPTCRIGITARAPSSATMRNCAASCAGWTVDHCAGWGETMWSVTCCTARRSGSPTRSATRGRRWRRSFSG